MSPTAPGASSGPAPLEIDLPGLFGRSADEAAQLDRPVAPGHAQQPGGHSFLPELRGCGCRQVSIETAQSQLGRAVLAQLDDKQIMVGCIDLSDMNAETPDVVAARIRRALPCLAKERVVLAPTAA